VPVLYNVIARFTERSDEPEEKDAGTTFETAFLPAIPGAVNSDLGLSSDSRLYWRFRSGQEDGVARGLFPSASTNGQPEALIRTSDPIRLFQPEAVGVVYQHESGALSLIRSDQGWTGPIPLFGAPECQALALDKAGSVYCRTENSIYRSIAPNYDFWTVLYQGLPFGSTLHVDLDRDTLYFSSASAILSLRISGGIGSFANPTVVLPRPGVTELIGNADRFFFLDGSLRASAGKEPATATFPTNVSNGGLVRYLMTDPNSTLFAWAGSANGSIFHVYYSGDSLGRTAVFGTFPGITGMVADARFIYVAFPDGTIRRASRASF
jgi:hypothetical protein